MHQRRRGALMGIHVDTHRQHARRGRRKAVGHKTVGRKAVGRKAVGHNATARGTTGCATSGRQLNGHQLNGRRTSAAGWRGATQFRDRCKSELPRIEPHGGSQIERVMARSDVRPTLSSIFDLEIPADDCRSSSSSPCCFSRPSFCALFSCRQWAAKRCSRRARHNESRNLCWSHSAEQFSLVMAVS